jgi:hypothetical protein
MSPDDGHLLVLIFGTIIGCFAAVDWTASKGTQDHGSCMSFAFVFVLRAVPPHLPLLPPRAAALPVSCDRSAR